MFKWIDEAIIDEIKIVDGKHGKLDAELQTLKNSTTKRLQANANHVDEALLEIRRIINDQAASLAELKAVLAPNFYGASITNPQNPLLNIAAAAIALGTLAWLYG